MGHYSHWKIWNYYGTFDCEKWYKYQKEPITEAKKTTILWDFSLQTDRKLKSNRPDRVINDY